MLGFESMEGPEVQQIELGRSPESHSDSDPLLPNQADSEPSSIQEISILNDDDIENGSVPCCRICLETDCEEGNISRLFFLKWSSWVMFVVCLIFNFVLFF